MCFRKRKHGGGLEIHVHERAIRVGEFARHEVAVSRSDFGVGVAEPSRQLHERPAVLDPLRTERVPSRLVDRQRWQIGAFQGVAQYATEGVFVHVAPGGTAHWKDEARAERDIPAPLFQHRR